VGGSELLMRSRKIELRESARGSVLATVSSTKISPSF